MTEVFYDVQYKRNVHHKDAKIHEKNVSGIELLRRYTENIYKITKAIKPDAVITHSNVHPYLADITDVVRLHDYYPRSNCSIENMAARTFIAKVHTATAYWLTQMHPAASEDVTPFWL